MIRLRVLGSTELLDSAGRELSAVLAQPKRLALLAYLAACSGFHRRDTLHALFWPELDAARAREALNQAISFLRKELGGSPTTVIVSRGPSELGVEADAVWCDAAAFREHIEAKRHNEALELYRGDLLPGFFVEQASGFENWLEDERPRLRATAARAARHVAEAHESDQSFTAAVIAARRAVELAGLDERAVRELLALLDRLGDRAGALHAYEEFARRLVDELDAKPAPDTMSVIERIRTRASAGTVAPRSPDRNVAEPRTCGSVAAPTTEAVIHTRLTPDLELNGWRVVRELGRGGMATVYVAIDAKHDRQVALKVMRAESAQSIAADRFLREIAIMARLAHPHILPLIDSGAAGGTLYLVTPLVDGESLKARLRRDGRLPMTEALRLAREIASGLDYAHRQGVIHRDIKPANILLQDGQALVADFGIARALELSEGERVTGTGLSPGTPAYMSPEQAAGEPIDQRSDVYALGAVLYEMLTGNPPHSAPNAAALLAKVLTEPVVPPRSVVDEVSEQVDAAVLKALSKSPVDRFDSAAAFANALDTSVATDRRAARAVVLRRALTIYATASLASVAIAWVARAMFGLPDWVVSGVLLLVALAFPMMVLTGVATHIVVADDPRTVRVPALLSGARLGSWTSWVAPQFTWRRTAIGGALVLVGFAVITATVTILGALGIGPSASLMARGMLDRNERLLITDFRVAGVDSNLGPAVTGAVQAALAESSPWMILSTEARTEVLQRTRRPPGTAVDVGIGRELALREGIRAIVDGHVIGTGKSYEIGLRLVATDSGSVLVALSGKARAPDEILATVDRLARELRAAMGEPLKRVRATPPLERVTTHSMEALRLYTLATRQVDFQQSIDQLREALKADSEFALAWRKLAIVYSNAGIRNAIADSAAANAYRYKDKLPEVERLQVEGLQYGRLVDRPKGITAWERAIALSNGSVGLLNLERFLFSRREFVRAESLAMLAVERQSSVNFAFSNLAGDRINQGKLREAEEGVRFGLTRLPGVWDLEETMIRIMYLRGDLQGYQRALDSSMNSPGLIKRRLATQWRRDLALIRGQLKDWERLQESFRQLDSAAGAAPSPLADAIRVASVDLWLRLDTAQAVRRVLDVKRLQPAQFLNVALFLASAGQTALAREYQTRWDSLTDSVRHRIDQPAYRRVDALIARAEGRLADDLESTRKGDSRPDGPVDACHICLSLSLADAFDHGHVVDSAITMYEQYVNKPFTQRMFQATSMYALDRALQSDPLHLARVLRRLGALHDSLGHRDKALHYYARFVDLWKDADPDLHHHVRTVRSRMKILGSKLN